MRTHPQHSTILLQGGAIRGAFGAGVLYEFASQGYFANTIAAASASVPTAAYYAAHQQEEIRHIWLEEVGNPRFIQYSNLFAGKPIYDIEYLIGEIFKKKYALNTARLKASGTQLIVPLYNYQNRRLEIRTSADPDFEENVWSLLHIAMTIHDSHILWKTPYEAYVDGALDPFALFKLVRIPDNTRTTVIWNEPRFDMHPIKRLGQIIFMALQARTFPEEVKRMLRTRHRLISEGMRLYKQFCDTHRPIVIKPDRLSVLDGLDVLSKNNTHIKHLFDQGMEKARRVLENELAAAQEDLPRANTLVEMPSISGSAPVS